MCATTNNQRPTTNDQKKLIQILERNQWVIVHQTEGLTHADSLLQPPFRSNCLNWVLGHVAIYRDELLALLQQSPVLDDKEADPYRRGSDPIQTGESALALDRLLETLEETQERVAASLGSVADEDLDTVFDIERGRTVRERIEFLLWHETYHIGQLEFLRQLAGKNDGVI